MAISGLTARYLARRAAFQRILRSRNALLRGAGAVDAATLLDTYDEQLAPHRRAGGGAAAARWWPTWRRGWRRTSGRCTATCRWRWSTRATTRSRRRRRGRDRGGAAGGLARRAALDDAAAVHHLRAADRRSRDAARGPPGARARVAGAAAVADAGVEAGGAGAARGANGASRPCCFSTTCRASWIPAPALPVRDAVGAAAVRRCSRWPIRSCVPAVARGADFQVARGGARGAGWSETA